MKYMGSKKSMLKNGLGQLLLAQASKANRIFDPFCGSSSVVWFLAEKTDNQIIAGDLQKFSTDLANAILLRDELLQTADLNILENWINLSKSFHDIIKTVVPLEETQKFVQKNRILASKSPYSITHSYGGYYFSLDQALKLDSLLFFLPEYEPIHSLALSSLIEAASQCVASPGHTAQPFQPEGNGLKAILDAWKRDPFYYVQKFITDFSTRKANKIGFAKTTTATDLLDLVEEDDLVFLDPPYSGVHYSRFYHVLETIARNSWENVSGRGRYPSSERRPRSEFSLKGRSYEALDELLKKISQKKASAIVTFPAGSCSNGLSGELVKRIATNYFSISDEIIKGKFSTLGGNNSNRPARYVSEEVVLVLRKK